MTKPSKKFQMIGYDREDFEIVASLLQDSISIVSDFCFDQEDLQFFMILGRYKREEKNQINSSKRSLSGVCFDNVNKVVKKNFPALNSSDTLNLLSIIKNKDHVHIYFSGDIELKLIGRHISIRLDDLNQEWPTIFTPKHDL